MNTAVRQPPNSGYFVFPDESSYVGGVDEGRSQGLGVFVGPRRRGEFAGVWQCGYEVSGVYTSATTGPSSSSSSLSFASSAPQPLSTYEGQWQQGRRHGLGVERRKDWEYRGEWSQGFRGRYGIRQSVITEAKYGGTWTTGLQDGYGVETYGDGSRPLTNTYLFT